MVGDWDAAVTKFTELTPHLHYGTFSWRKAFNRATLQGQPCRIVVISTFETFDQRFNHEEADGLTFGILESILESSWIRPTGWQYVAPKLAKFRKANGMFVKMDSRNYNMHMASCKVSLEPQHKWMLMATPLVNGIEDLHWILHFWSVHPGWHRSWCQIQSTILSILMTIQSWMGVMCQRLNVVQGSR